MQRLRLLGLVILAMFLDLNVQGQFFLTSDSILPCEGCDSPFPCGLENPLSQNGVKKRYSYVSGTGKDYDRDGYSDQWLDIYIPTGAVPADGFPVIIYAHSLGQTASDPCFNADRINVSGVACISWESITENTRLINGTFPPMDMFYAAGDSDFQKVLLWVRDKAEQLTNKNLDLSKVYVAGTSRGTRLSFKDLTTVQNLETGGPLVKGAILTQAFPDPEWKIAEENLLANPVELVQDDYPPVLMLYESSTGIFEDLHDPSRGVQVLEELQCRNIPTALMYSNSYSLFSDELRPLLLDFIADPALLISSLSSSIISGNAMPPELRLRPPKQVSLKIKPTDPQRFRLSWKEDRWSELIEQPPYLACEARLADQASGDFCTSFQEGQVYVNSSNMSNGIPSQFNLPSAYVNACNLPAALVPGASYDVQVRCFIRIPGFDSYSTDTPWSDKVSVTIPTCSDILVEEGKSVNYSLAELGINSYLVSSLEFGPSYYSLYDLMGRLIAQGNFTEGLPIDLSAQATGMYILTLWNETKEVSQFQMMKL